MKVFIIADAARFGGTRSFLLNLVKINYQCKNEIVLLVDENDLDSLLLNELKKFNVNLLRTKKRTRIFRLKYFSLIFELINFMPNLWKYKPDLIVSSTGNPGFNFFLFFLNYPLIYYLHSISGKISWKGRLFYLIPQKLTNKSKLIITVSNFAKNNIVELWRVSSENVKIVYNSPSFKKRVIIKESNNYKRVILTIGHVVWYKNPKMWVSVARGIINKFSDVEFLWIGDGPLKNEMNQICVNDERIKFVGSLRDVQSYYTNSYLYFQPSLVESLGICVLEAQFYGLPSVVSDSGGLPETIINFKTGFVVKNICEKYIEAISKLLTDNVLYDDMKINALVNSKNNFTERIQKNKIIDIINSVINA